MIDGSEWIDRVFEIEYREVPQQDMGRKKQQWLESTSGFSDFDEFYDEVVQPVSGTRYDPGSNEAYSIRNLETGEEVNCEGAATIAAIAGELIYDEELTVIAEYDVERSLDGEVIDFQHHVSLEDEEGNRYGGSAASFYQEPVIEELETEILADIYAVNRARREQSFGDQSRADELLEGVGSSGLQSRCLNQRLAVGL